MYHSFTSQAYTKNQYCNDRGITSTKVQEEKLWISNPRTRTSISVCQVARATGEAKCHGSKLHKEVIEIKVYWFVCLNTFKFAKVRMDYSRHDIYTCNHVGFSKFPLHL